MPDLGTLTGVLAAAARTHPGRVRSNNEDLPVLDAARGIFGVIDGIGGQVGGEVAAVTARDVILQRLARPVGTAAERVREAIAIANNEIYRRATGSPELAGMGCVITLAIVQEGRLTIGHVGDTRLYKIGGDGVRKVTRDHSPVGEREDAGELSELDAMRHPRRHEVFRDVGTLSRDKDEREFVDVIELPLEADAAILICSDGLTDMVPSATIGQVVRQYAGTPERVVDTLVAAANEAGGKDNVTVVYAEMPLFADRMRRAAADDRDFAGLLPGAADTEQLPPRAGLRVGLLKRTARAIVASRTTWFAAGALGGVLAALALTAYVASRQAPAARTLVVASDGSAPFGTIAAATAAAAPGDEVRIEPGTYRESVSLGSGVTLAARTPGTVTVGPSPEAGAPLLTIGGGAAGAVSGVIFDAAGMSVPVVRVAAPAASLDLIEIGGHPPVAFELANGADLTVRGSRISTSGSIVAVGDESHATFVNTVFLHDGQRSEIAITATPSAHLALRGNVFSGFGGAIVTGPAPAAVRELLSGNAIVPVEAPVSGSPAATGGRGARPPSSRGTVPAGRGTERGRGRGGER